MDGGLVDRVVRIVERNSGGLQPEAVSEHVVVMIATKTGHTTPASARDALETAVQSGRLEEVDGDYRVPEDT